MKNQYFGDINDYRKYGLLRLLSAKARMKIGVCWMLTEDDATSHGKFTGYLKRPGRWEKYDCGLLWRLRESVLIKHMRNVAQMRSMGIVPAAKCHEWYVRDERSQRAGYFRRAFRKFKGVDLIFFDPDNGIEVQRPPRGAKGSSKFLYWEEVRQGTKSGKSLLIFQIFPPKPHQPFIAERLRDIKIHTGAPEVHTFKAPKVAFFLVVQRKHSKFLHGRIEEVKRSAWQRDRQIMVYDEKSVRR